MGRDHDEAFTTFVVARQAALLRFAVLLAGDRSRGEDLLQSVLARTYVHWGRLRDPEAAEAYVRRGLLNAQTSWWRSAARRHEVFDAHDDWSPRDDASDGTSAVAGQVDLLRLLSTLAPRQRAVVVLHYWEDRSERECAQLLGISVGTVKSQASRALATLRTALLAEAAAAAPSVAASAAATPGATSEAGCGVPVREAAQATEGVTRHG